MDDLTTHPGNAKMLQTPKREAAQPMDGSWGAVAQWHVKSEHWLDKWVFCQCSVWKEKPPSQRAGHGGQWLSDLSSHQLNAYLLRFIGKFLKNYTPESIKGDPLAIQGTSHLQHTQCLWNQILGRRGGWGRNWGNTTMVSPLMIQLMITNSQPDTNPHYANAS